MFVFLVYYFFSVHQLFYVHSKYIKALGASQIMFTAICLLRSFVFGNSAGDNYHVINHETALFLYNSKQ